MPKEIQINTKMSQSKPLGALSIWKSNLVIAVDDFMRCYVRMGVGVRKVSGTLMIVDVRKV